MGQGVLERMISSQRLIMFVIMLNIMIGIGLAINNNITSTTEPYTPLDDEILRGNGTLGRITADSTKYGNVKQSGDTVLDTTFGNQKGMGGIIWDIFIGAVNPFTGLTNVQNSNMEKTLIYGLITFRMIVNLLLFFELYLILFNKKQT